MGLSGLVLQSVSGYGSVMDARPDISFDQRLELEEYAHKRANGDEILLSAFLPLVSLAQVEALRRGDGQLALGLLQEAAAVVRDIKHVLTPPDTDRERPWDGRLWEHYFVWVVPFDGGPDRPWWQSAKDQAEAAAAAYLKLPWMSCGYLDWALIDAFTLGEFRSFNYEFVSKKKQPFWERAMEGAFAIAPWLLEGGALALSGAWLASEFSSEAAPYRWWWAAGIGAYYFWFGLNLLMYVPAGIRAKQAKLDAKLFPTTALLAMQRSYYQLSGRVLDPTRVRDFLLAAEKDNVVWPCAIWPLLETAIARHPHVWHTGY